MPQQTQPSSHLQPGAASGNRYGAFLVRCWLDGCEWRFSLESIEDRRRQGFERLEDLIQALTVALGTLVENE